MKLLLDNLTMMPSTLTVENDRNSMVMDAEGSWVPHILSKFFLIELLQLNKTKKHCYSEQINIYKCYYSK